MTKKAFDKIAAGLRDAIAIVRGDAKPARIYRGTISFDEPTRWKSSDSRWDGRRRGKGRDLEHYREWKRAWREKNREHVREYHREYYRKYVAVGKL